MRQYISVGPTNQIKKLSPNTVKICILKKKKESKIFFSILICSEVEHPSTYFMFIWISYYIKFISWDGMALIIKCRILRQSSHFFGLCVGSPVLIGLFLFCSIVCIPNCGASPRLPFNPSSWYSIFSPYCSWT